MAARLDIDGILTFHPNGITGHPDCESLSPGPKKAMEATTATLAFPATHYTVVHWGSDRTPAVIGIHHITLTVSDLDRSIAWYCDLLGFREVRRLSAGGLEKAMLARDGIVATFVFHGDASVPGLFSERRCCLDHLSFAVPDRNTLDAWVARLDAADVVRGEVTTATTGDLVAFRDPDNIALEFYTRP